MATIFDPKCKLDLYLIGNEKYTIEDLDMDFSITLTSKSEPNTAEITVYNLSEATRNKFSGRHQALDFYAGYGDEVRLIFRGHTYNVAHERSGPDWATKISCAEGLKDFTLRYFSKSYSKGTKVSQIISDMVDAIQLPSMIDITIDTQILSGECYSGRAKECLDEVCYDYDLIWSVVNGVTEVRHKWMPLGPYQSTAIDLTGDGVFSRPTLVTRSESVPRPKFIPPLVEQTKMSKAQRDQLRKDTRAAQLNAKYVNEIDQEENKDVPGIEISAALNPDLKPGRLIKAANTTDGQPRIYLIDTVRHSGASGREYTSECIADL